MRKSLREREREREQHKIHVETLSQAIKESSVGVYALKSNLLACHK